MYVLAILKRIWRSWKALAHALVRAQSWLAMALAYWVALMPVALVMKIVRPDPLDRGRGDPDASSLGKEHLVARQDIRRAQRPW